MKTIILAVLVVGAGLAQLSAQSSRSTATMSVRDLEAERSPLSAEISIGYLLETETEAFSVGSGYYLAGDSRHYVGLEATWFEADETEMVDEVQIDSRLKAMLAMVVYRFQWPLGSLERYHLMLGAGVGASFLELTGSAPMFGEIVRDKSQRDVTGQLTARINGRITERWGGHLGYRHFRIWDAELFGVKSDFKDNIVEAGFHYRF